MKTVTLEQSRTRGAGTAGAGAGDAGGAGRVGEGGAASALGRCRPRRDGRAARGRVVEVVGLKGTHDRERTAVRHGHESGEVTLGAVAVERPRVRSAGGCSEGRLRTCEYFADRDPLSRSVLERMLAGVSARRYCRTHEPVDAEVERSARSTSKLREDPARPLEGFDREGHGRDRRCSPTWSSEVSTPSRGSSSSSTVPRPCGKRSAPSSATRPSRGCVRHKERNVTDHLPSASGRR